jgi:predicted metal-binding membrane protein
MTSLTIGLPSRRWSPTLVLARRPELPAAALVAGAWIWLGFLQLRPAAGAGAMTGDPSMPSMPGMTMPGTSMPGMSMPGSHSTGAGGAWSAVTSGMPMWVLMVVAMMGPAALAGLRHTSRNSLCWRRRRAMAQYALGYVAVWTAYGVVALALGSFAWAHGEAALPIVLLAAAGYQFTRYKRRALRDCHRATPLPPRGWRAEAAALRFGGSNGAACVGSCWCLMLVMVVASAGMFWWEVALAAVLTTERLLERPRRWTRYAGVGLGVAALGAAAVAVA